MPVSHFVRYSFSLCLHRHLPFPFLYLFPLPSVPSLSSLSSPTLLSLSFNTLYLPFLPFIPPAYLILFCLLVCPSHSFFSRLLSSLSFSSSLLFHTFLLFPLYLSSFTPLSLSSSIIVLCCTVLCFFHSLPSHSCLYLAGEPFVKFLGCQNKYIFFMAKWVTVFCHFPFSRNAFLLPVLFRPLSLLFYYFFHCYYYCCYYCYCYYC